MLSGSIACYKACDVISQLVKSGNTVKTVCSQSALQFIGPATLEGLTGEAPYTTSFEGNRMMSHIDLARWADLIVLCPASAHSINALAHGVGDGLIADIFLSNNFQKKFMIAPAMNTQMLLHPATQQSLEQLRKWGTIILDTDSGSLACGEKGEGRLLAPSILLEKILMELKS